MSGSTLRRTVLCLVVLALLLPLTSAYAAPAGRSESARIQLPEWSRILLAPLNGLMELFQTATEVSSMPPGHKPGNDEPGSGNREGNGFDPHGKP